MSMPATRTAPFANWAMLLGAAAPVLTLVHLFAGPFAPVDSAGVTLGELAAEIQQSGLRALRGEPQPEAQPRPWDIDRILALATAAIGAVAIVLAVIGFVQHEPRRAVIGGFGLGATAIAFQLIAWLAFAILGTMIVIALVQSLDLDFG